MALREETRTFFVLYSNGETFYFTVDSNNEIYCTRFKNIYENAMKRKMPGAHSVEFTGNSFSLKNAAGETICSLQDYLRTLRMTGNITIPNFENASIERLYIDEDVRINLLANEKLKYDADASRIPGLLYEPVQNVSSYTRVKTK